MTTNLPLFLPAQMQRSHDATRRALRPQRIDAALLIRSVHDDGTRPVDQEFVGQPGIHQ
jgi:hypothetical protein